MTPISWVTEAFAFFVLLGGFWFVFSRKKKFAKQGEAAVHPNFVDAPVQFPLYALDVSEFRVLPTKKDLEREIELADLRDTDLYDALFRAVRAEQSVPLNLSEYTVTLDPTQDPAETALQFRHNLIGFCLNHAELGLASDAVFAMPLDILVAEIASHSDACK